MGDDSLGRRTRRAKAPVSYAEADESETEAEPPVKRARRTKAGDSAEFDAADPKPAKGKGRKPNAPLAAPEGGLPVNVTAPLSASQAAASPAVAPSPKKKPRSRTNAATSNPDEARAERYRSVPNKAVMDRLKRAKGQSMFVVERKVLSEHAQEFHVLGSVGNIYKVPLPRLRPDLSFVGR